jgi:hypothetical protein
MPLPALPRWRGTLIGNSKWYHWLQRTHTEDSERRAKGTYGM